MTTLTSNLNLIQASDDRNAEAYLVTDLGASLGIVDGLFGQWVDWTPTWTQSASVTFTTTNCRYRKQGKNARIQLSLTATGAGTLNNGIVIGNIPAAITPKYVGYENVGSGTFLDSGTGFVSLSVIAFSTTTLRFFAGGYQDYFGGTNGGGVGGIATTVAIGDVITVSAEWEIA